MNLNNPAEMVKDAASEYPIEIRKVAVTEAVEAYKRTIAAHGGSEGQSARRDALETSLKVLHRTARAAVAKATQADALSMPQVRGYWDFSTSPTAAQASAEDARTLEVQGIAAAVGLIRFFGHQTKGGYDGHDVERAKAAA